MLQIYYGDGKGKTTAAIGAAVRAAGAGCRVIYVRFLKSRQSGETEVLKHTKGISVITLKGKYPFYKDMTDEDKKAVSIEHNQMLSSIAEQIKSNDDEKCVVVCDELLHVIGYGLCDRKEAVRIILENKERVEFIITGRSITSDTLKNNADYITEMKAHRHPFERGIMAREGIEY